MDFHQKVNMDNEAIKDETGRSLTYGELFESSQKFQKKVGTRRLIFIICDNSIETFSLYFQVMCSKNVPLLLPESIDDNKLKNLLTIYKPMFIWSKKTCLVRTEWKTMFENGNYILRKTNFSDISLNKELALLLMTSGSSGNPKLVRISYRNLQCNIPALADTFLMTERDKGITTLPINFCYGLSVLHVHWYVGATVLAVKESMFSNKFWDLFNKEKVTNFAGVFETYKMLKLCGFCFKSYPHLRFMSQAGNKMPTDLIKLFLSNHPDTIFFSCYGQTEGTSLLTSLDCGQNPFALESIGKPFSNWKVELKETNESGIGELVLLGDTVSMGYAEGINDLALGDSNKGVLYTGDLAKIGSDGNIYLAGRKKRFLKLMGMRINLDDIEEYAKKLLPDLEFACTGEDNHLIVYYTKGDVEAKKFTEQIAGFINVNSHLISVRHIEQIPRTSSGKINYGGLV